MFAPLGLLSGVLGPVLPRAVAEPVGRGAAVARPVAHRRAAAGALGVRRPSRARAGAEPRRAARRARTRASLERRWCGVRSLAVAVAVLLAALDRRPVLRRRHRVPAAGRRRRLRHRLPDAGGHGARGDRSPGAGDREGRCARRRRSRRIRGAPARSWACSRRRRTPATSSCGSSRAASASRSSEEIISDAAAEAARGGAARRDRVRAAAAGHARRSRRQPDADRSQDLRRRSRACSTELAEPVEEMLGKIDGVVDVVGMQRGNPEVDVERSIRRRPAALGLTVEQVAAAARGGAGSARWRPTCGCWIAASRCACGCRTRFASIRHGSPQTLLRSRRRQARPGVEPGARDARERAGASCCARTSRRWRSSPGASKDATSGSAVAEIRTTARRHEAAGRLHLRDRRAVRVAAAGVPRAADGVRHRRGAGVHDPRRAVPRVHCRPC